MSRGLKICLATFVFAVLPMKAYAADCEAEFTQIPDYIVAGDGTCVHGGLGPGGGDPTDTLEVDVTRDGAPCEDCTVVVTASWIDGAGAPQSSDSPVKKKPWPHKV